MEVGSAFLSLHVTSGILFNVTLFTLSSTSRHKFYFWIPKYIFLTKEVTTTTTFEEVWFGGQWNKHSNLSSTCTLVVALFSGASS